MPIIDVEGTEIDFPDDMTDQEIDYRIRSEILPQLDRERTQETLAPGALYGDLPIIPSQEKPAEEPTETGFLGGFDVARRLATGDPVGAGIAAFRQLPAGQQEATARGAAQGVTLGFADELTAAVEAVPGLFTGEGVGARYRRAREESRARYRTAGEDYPVTYAAGEIAGGLATGGAGAGRAVAGQTLRQALPRLATAGAAAGGAAGAGYTEAETLPEVVRDVATGAAAGAVAAPAITAAGAGVARAVTGGWKRARTATEAFQRGRRGELTAEGLRQTKNRAVQEVTDALEADEIDPARIGEIFQSNPNLILADLGPSLQRKIGAVSRQPGIAAQQIAKQVEARNIDQLDRLAPTLQRALGETDTITALKNSVQRTKELAAPLYDEAYATQLRGTATLQRIMERDASKKALSKARELASNEGVDLTGPQNNIKLMDYVQRALRDQEGKAIRTGANNEARIIGNTRRDLLREVDRQAPAFRQARAIAADEFANRDALDLGKRIFREETPAFGEAVRDMSQSQREHLRIGVFDAVMNRLRSKSETANLVQDFKKPKVRDAIELAFNDPQQFGVFTRALGDEQKMFETMAQVLRGSPTAERVQADRALQQGVDAATDVITGTPQSLLRRAASRATEAFTGGRDSAQQRLTQETIADLLTRRPGAAELAPLPAPTPPPVAPQAINPLLPQTALPTTEQILQGLLPQ